MVNHFSSWDNTVGQPRTVRYKEQPGSLSPETRRAWSACDAVQNLGLLPLPESAASSLVAAIVVIALYNALLL